jgi:phosphoglycolate phosphatase-like HAD superfamily hydrolase
MTEKIIVVDYSGTLIKSFVAEEANLKRYEILGIEKPDSEIHKQLHATKQHYDIIKEHIEKDMGITSNMKIRFMQNYGNDIELTGKDVQTMIMTDLFRDAMYIIANQYKEKIFADGILDILQELQHRGYKLAIVSGIRKDIITGMLAIAGCDVKFDFIHAQDPVLSHDNNDLMDKELSKHGKIEYIIGDKLSDLEPAKLVHAKSIFVTWGHPTGGEEDTADYTINKPEELLRIIR